MLATSNTTEITITLPKGYVHNNGHIYKTEVTEVAVTDAEGREMQQDVTELDLACPQELHILSTHRATRGTVMEVLYRNRKGERVSRYFDIRVLATAGPEFEFFLRGLGIDAMLGMQERIRGYLVDCLSEL